MSLANFKRISRHTTEEIAAAQAYLDAHLLPTLLSILEDEWDEYLEPEEPLEEEREFGPDNVCPECHRVKLGLSNEEWAAAVNVRNIRLGLAHVPTAPTGHTLACSRWKRSWAK